MNHTLTKCELCQRGGHRLTRHHLIPRCRHKNKKNKREFSRDEVHTRIVLLCKDCHDAIHNFFSEKILEKEMNTLDSLREDPRVAKFVSWVQKR